MAIANAVQRGSSVYVYDEKGRQLTVLSGELHGYTGSSVSIKRGSSIYTYDERGRQQSVNLGKIGRDFKLRRYPRYRG
jgi:hypothetical protein